MKPFTMVPVRSLRPTATPMAYLGVAAAFDLWGQQVMIVAPDAAGLEQVCENWQLKVDLLLSKDAAVLSANALSIADGLEDGL